MKKFSPVVALVAVLALAGCGGHHPAQPRVAPQPCPPGKSFMGCGTPHALAATPKPLTVPAGHLFPDVSSYQGHPNWSAAKPRIAGAYAKASEYFQDPDFAWNVGQLKRLGIRWGAYDFVRSCSAATFIAALRSVGGPSSLPPVIDMEVPAARGCAPSLEAQIHAAFGRTAVIYTAPGTWPGGSNAGLAVWEATYGPSFSPVWHPVLAWQFTDGRWGSVVSIPGIGTGDVSVDYGLLEQVPNLLPLCFTHRIPTAQCAAVKAKIASWQRAAASSLRAWDKLGDDVLFARMQWFSSHLNKPPRSKHAYRAAALASTQRAYKARGGYVLMQRYWWFLGQVDNARLAN